MSTRFIRLSFLAVAFFCISACNGNEEKTTSNTMSGDTATTTSTTETAPASTIVTTPQHMMIVKHRVGNYAKFKISYDEHDSLRLAHGMHNYVIGRAVGDSNMLFVAVKADDLAKAKAFAKDPSLKKAMQKAGVTGTPAISLVTVTYQDTAEVGDVIRSQTNFAVKDWDAWKKGFEDGKQERIDNGIVDRVYGHDADDNTKVTLVTAIMDSAKAAGYWESDMIKKRRVAGGVIGVPDRFLFRVVQRY